VINTLYRWMGIPTTPPSWSADLIIREEKKLSFTKNLGSLAIIIAGFGLLVTCCRALISRKISIVSVAISTAFLVLGIASRWIANAHFKGLSAEDRKTFALEELKKAFEELPVCESKEDLEEKVANDPDFSSFTAIHAVGRANEICDLAFPRYCPIRDLQPIFDIMGVLSPDQKLELLETAYSKKIILAFPLDCRLYDPTKSSPPNHLDKIGWLGRQKMEGSFNLSLAFLKRIFDTPLSFDQEMLNKQLEALSVRWSNSGHLYVSYPSFDVESRNTLVIRNHLLSSKEVLSALRELSPFVSFIKVEEMKSSIYEDDYEGLGKKTWSLEKQDLQTNPPTLTCAKSFFVDRTNEQVDIWQEIDQKEESLKEIAKDILKDIKNNKYVKSE